MLKLLYIGVCAGSESMPKYFKRHFDQYQDISPGNAINAKVQFTPDIIFYQLQADKHGNESSVKVGEHYNKRFPEAFKINWSGDKRNGTEKWFFDFAKFVDVTTFSNEEDVNNLQKKGLRSEFMQIGIDPEIFTRSGEVSKAEDIVFLANNHSGFPLSQERQKIASLLNINYGNKFGLYGIGWRKGSGNLTGDEQMQRREATLYRGAKIAISVSNFNAKRYTSDRLLRAMASGVMVLSHNYKGIELDFMPGEHLDVFNNHNELQEKINYYLANPQKRKQIALSGCQYVHKKFTLDNMFGQIKKLYNEGN